MNEGITYELPEKIDHNNVVYYSNYLKELVDKHGKKVLDPIRRKAQIFIQEKCIEYDHDEKCYICKPLENYNKTTYKLKEVNGKFECNCQGFQKKAEQGIDPYCSHTTALMFYFKILNWENKLLRARYGN